MEPQIMQLQRETRSSIEVTHYKDGSPGWVIKKYFADGEEEAALAAIQALEVLLRAFYLDGGVDELQARGTAVRDALAALTGEGDG